METAIAAAALGLSVLGPIVAFLFAGSRATGAQAAFEATTTKTLDAAEMTMAQLAARIRVLEIEAARGEQVVTGLKQAIEAFRTDMDRRFDQLERMLTGTGSFKRPRNGDG